MPRPIYRLATLTTKRRLARVSDSAAFCACCSTRSKNSASSASVSSSASSQARTCSGEGKPCFLRRCCWIGTKSAVGIRYNPWKTSNRCFASSVQSSSRPHSFWRRNSRMYDLPSAFQLSRTNNTSSSNRVKSGGSMPKAPAVPCQRPQPPLPPHPSGG